jgi:hypothetical protein
MLTAYLAKKHIDTLSVTAFWLSPNLMSERTLICFSFSIACLLTCMSCVNTAPQYTGRTPSGGQYIAMAPPRWEFAPFGMVRLPRAPLPSFSPPPRADSSYWHGDGINGRPHIHITIGEQMAYYYKGEKLVGAAPICTGSPEFPTPKGSFRILEKDHDHLSSIYGDYIDKNGGIVQTQIDNRTDPRPPGTRFDGAKMHWFMRVTGAVGMHEGYLPGYADSHGCIRLPTHMAKIFFENTPVGTPVKITD